MSRTLRRRELLELGGLSLVGGLFLPRALANSAAAPARLVQSLRPQNLATDLSFFDREIVPTEAFFVRSHFGPPALRTDRRLRVHGLVRQDLDLSQDEVRALPATSLTAVLQCAGNGRALHEPRVAGVQWVHGGMGQASWTGVRLRELLTRAGVDRAGAHVVLEVADLPPKPAVPAFSRSIPLARAMDPTTLVAWEMNGAPLRLAHGAPLRLVVPGWSGNHWLKWLVGIRVEREEAEGFYQRTGYKLPRTPVAPGAAVPPEDMIPVTTFPVKSVIARPAEGGHAPAGTQEVLGVAFSGVAAIRKVEVSTDGGATFVRAEVEGAAGVGKWQVFRHRFDARAGRASAVVRATDAAGNVQPENAAWNPSGYFWNGWHRVEWEVA